VIGAKNAMTTKYYNFLVNMVEARSGLTCTIAMGTNPLGIATNCLGVTTEYSNLQLDIAELLIHVDTTKVPGGSMTRTDLWGLCTDEFGHGKGINGTSESTFLIGGVFDTSLSDIGKIQFVESQSPVRINISRENTQITFRFKYSRDGGKTWNELPDSSFKTYGNLIRIFVRS
jgi:hypothetical protein